MVEKRRSISYRGKNKATVTMPVSSHGNVKRVKDE